MSKSVKWSFQITVDGEPSRTLAGTTQAEGADSISVTVPKGTSLESPVDVEVQPGDAQHIKLLYIKSSLHDKVSYKLSSDETSLISDLTKNSKWIKLDSDHVINSSELINNAIGISPKFLRFANIDTGNDSNIEIFVLRNALKTPA